MSNWKNERNYRAPAEPVAVLDAALAQLRQRAQARAVDAPAFIPATRFTGRKQGYFFSRGLEGVGYYRDARQALPEPGVDGGLPADDEQAGVDAEAQAEAREPKAVAAPLDPEELLRQAEEQAHIDEIQLLDAKAVRRLAAALEKRCQENLVLRSKHAGDPMKFLDNEVDLLSTVKELAQVASTPELYPLLAEAGAVATLAGLLGHENVDVAAEVAATLAEMTDEGAGA